jgi:hypothetical protein
MSEYYKEMHASFEENLEVIHSYGGFFKPVTIEREERVAYCNCEESYLFNGLNSSAKVKTGSGEPRPTIVNSDGETCKFCEHYISWETARIKGAWGRKKVTK